MKKRLLTLLLAATFIFSMAGCSLEVSTNHHSNSKVTESGKSKYNNFNNKVDDEKKELSEKIKQKNNPSNDYFHKNRKFKVDIDEGFLIDSE